MDIQGWRYYNHAAIPTTPPHIEPDLTPIKDGTIWKIDGSPLLARWTTDFDCGYETNWWYVIKDAPFDIADVSSKNQKSIRQALRKCYVKRVNFDDYIDAIYDCYLSAYAKYENADNLLERKQFIDYCYKLGENIDFWAGFETESNDLIGFLIVKVEDNYVELLIAKFNPNYSNKRVSDALYYAVLDFYLNNSKKTYVSSGSRNINHKTKTQEYKIERFGFRKAYCNLFIEYKPQVKLLVKVTYLLKNILIKFDGNTLIHQINSIIKMEEIVRGKNYKG